MATVLVADDSVFVRDVIAALARSLGHDVIEAANGVEAVARFEELRPDVVLLDITMPEMDRLEALRRIRSIDPEARVAMVTALGSQQVVMEALRSGASEFLVKPVGRLRASLRPSSASLASEPSPLSPTHARSTS